MREASDTTAAAGLHASAHIPTVVELVRARAAASPGGAAMVIDDETISNRGLELRGAQLSVSLRRAGVEPGDRVATLLPSCREIVETLVAASDTGAVFVPLNFRYRAHELRQVLADCRPAVVVVDDDPALEPNRADLLRQVIGEWGSDGVTLRRSAAAATFGIHRVLRASATETSHEDGYEAFLGGEVAGDEADGARRAGPLAIMFTSGTSAAPKGALVPEAAFTIRQAAIADRLGIRQQDHVYSPLPLFHIAGYIPLLSALSAGATYVTNRYFEAAAACRMIERHRCRVAWTGFDTIMRSIVEAAEAGAGTLASLEVDAVIGPPSSLQELEGRLGGCRVLSIYGATELGSAATLPSPEDEFTARTESSGVELEGTTLVIKDADGRMLPPGEPGEICGRGAGVVLGYYVHGCKPDRAAFDEDGWFHSGDLGLRLPDGRIRYISRLKDLIKVGGENVSPAEIEDFLIGRPDIVEVKVVGVPDANLGEVPVAFVQLAPDASAAGHEEVLRSYCEEHLSRVRVPSAFVYLADDEWPRSATKIRTNDLRDMFVAGRPGRGNQSSPDAERTSQREPTQPLDHR